VSHAHDERLALCRLFIKVGPDAPTECAGWTARDLAAHLVVRERRPDAALGVLVPPMAGYGERIRTQLRDGTPYARIVEMVAQGAPAWSPFALPGVDSAANLVEYFTHHEDVRRAQPGWEPRELTPAFERTLWNRLAMARLTLRRAPAGVRLHWSAESRPGGPEQVVKRGAPMVTVSGGPAELMLWTLGRTSVARVAFDGDTEAVERLRAASWGI
jgi:uncharacterized protein (TIGR03085 family)